MEAILANVCPEKKIVSHKENIDDDNRIEDLEHMIEVLERRLTAYEFLLNNTLLEQKKQKDKSECVVIIDAFERHIRKLERDVSEKDAIIQELRQNLSSATRHNCNICRKLVTYRHAQYFIDSASKIFSV